MVKPLDRGNQADRSLLHEVFERNASASVGPRDGVHQPQVAFDHLFVGFEDLHAISRGSGSSASAARVSPSGCAPSRRSSISARATTLAMWPATPGASES